MKPLLLSTFRSASSPPSFVQLFGYRASRPLLQFSTAAHGVSLRNSPPVEIADAPRSTHPSDSITEAAPSMPKPIPATPSKARPRIRATKAAMTLTPNAVSRLRSLLTGPTPQYIRIGVRNKGCAGMSYHLEYVEKPDKFDETVEQDGVKVLIDSRALFSIIGSEMDWKEDRLSAKFAFRNPNVKDACGCGESFTVAV